MFSPVSPRAEPELTERKNLCIQEEVRAQRFSGIGRYSQLCRRGPPEQTSHSTSTLNHNCQEFVIKSCIKSSLPFVCKFVALVCKCLGDAARRLTVPCGIIRGFLLPPRPAELGCAVLRFFLICRS